jgi:hypothetical protein
MGIFDRNRNSISEVLSLKHNINLGSNDVSTIAGIAYSNKARLDIDEQQLENHENRIHSLESVTGVSDTITIVTDIDFDKKTATKKKLTFSNGILTKEEDA